MSLYLPEQKLGSHSQTDSSSHKFMLKGRQTGSMHRGHSWIFRAESHDTMLAWYEDLKNLTEKTGEARNAFVRRHARTASGASYRPSSISSDGAMEEDEADETPYSADHVMAAKSPSTVSETQWQRPEPGGRFPSDVHINRNVPMPQSPSSAGGSGDRDVVGGTGNRPGSIVSFADQPEHISHPGLKADHGSIERRPSHNYAEWMAPQSNSATIAAEQPAPITPAHIATTPNQYNSEHHDSRHVAIKGSKKPSADSQPHLETIASASDVPDITQSDDPGMMNNSSRTYAENVNPATVNTKSNTPAFDTGRTSKQQQQQQQQYREGRDGFNPSYENASGPKRASTFDELKFPGQFPNPQSSS